LVDETVHHEGAGTGQCESFRLWESLNDLGDWDLERRQQDRDDPAVTFYPVGPCFADVEWQYQLVPKFDELVNSNEPADVVFVPLPEHLLVHPGAIPAIGQVVTPGCTEADEEE
jgi:hypothetical protein